MILNYWSTPIMKGEIQNNKLRESIVNHILVNYGESNKVSANVQNQNLFDDTFFDDFKKKEVIPAFDKFYKQEFNISLKEKKFKLRSWVTGYGVSYAMPKHNHSGSHLSAVFYLMAEESDKGGKIVISDPRFNANRGYKDEFKKWFEPEVILPYTGQFLIFPSFLYHNVETYYGKLRLAMPVDLILYDNE